MRIEIQCPKTIRTSEELRARAVLVNDQHEPVEVSRNAFIGPNVKESNPSGLRPDSVEPTFGRMDQPLTLHPFSFYGRERAFRGLAAGEATVSARYRTPEGHEISASEQVLIQP